MWNRIVHVEGAVREQRRRHGLPFVLSCLLLLAVPAAKASQTWYVSTTGSDANPGTNPGSPLQHVQTALNNAHYGDTVNIQAGTYREQVFLPIAWTYTAGTGSLGNMLTVQAWDTNNDGIIESNEVPTINAFQVITNWTSLSDTNEWATLTGGAVYQPNTIFWTYWSSNDTINEPFNMIAESDTSVLLPTSWPNYNSCDHPILMPTYMTKGSFQYDYNQHILYVWRSDGKVPGPAYPIQAPYLDPSLSAWGGMGPFGILPGYFHVKGLRFRFCNGVNNPNEVDAGSSGVSLGPYSVLENCDSEWMAYQGGISFASVVTNCIFSNNGEMGLGIYGTNELVTGCTFSNNNFTHYTGGCMNEGALHLSIINALGGPNLGGTLVSNNIFINNNWEDSIHVDTGWGTPSNLCVIANNFIFATNGQSGVNLEISSYIGIYNNIICVGSAVFADGSQGIRVVNNTIHGGVNVLPDPYRPGGPGGPYPATNNLVANNIIVQSINQPNIGAGLDTMSATATVYGPVCYSNVFANNLCWNYLPGSNLNLGTIWFNMEPPPYSNSIFPLEITNINVWAHLISGTDTPFQNTGNFISDPLFSNPANLTNPAVASYYVPRWDSPARNAAGTANFGVTTDFLGNPRGLYPDVGAYQTGLLFWDNFARTSPLAPWVAASGSWALGNGSLRGSSGYSSYASAYLTNVWTNFAVLANIQFSSASGYGGGVASCVNASTGARYAAWVYPEGSPISGGNPVLKLLKFQNWTSWSYLGTAGEPIAQAHLGGVSTNWHALELAIQGTQMTVYLDGAQVLSASDAEASPYSSGGVGLDMYTGPSLAYGFSVSNVEVEAYSPRPINAGLVLVPAAPANLQPSTAQ